MSILDDLQSVADAIRSKTGKTDKMMLAEMPGEIENISGSGGDSYPHPPLSIYVYPVIVVEAQRIVRTYPTYQAEVYLTD
ncbi:hypothetical protein [Roseburia sp. AM59-24XD]|uniref:hypothetical protein n=1 Tax=Roseburia sp. AM59-24XD TaxID=2293138 RepID=UPI000E535207|nr:hypothetical protein [Roseburia sp. AM59-24XD]RHP87795.1 hypothetical protein DXA20_03100 [Roseburia sp. AM59-24XD]